MSDSVNLKIKQLDERVSTNGAHMGGDRRRRKLEPGEVVAIPRNLETDGGKNLLELLLATDRLEITQTPPTRPLDYESETEAKYCSPTFRPVDESQVRDMEIARETVRQRLRDNTDEAKQKRAAAAARKKAAKAKAEAERQHEIDEAAKAKASASRRDARRAVRASREEPRDEPKVLTG